MSSTTEMTAAPESEGARRATVEPGARGPMGALNPEVTERAKRRRFTAEYKLSILRKADACKGDGDLGALLRREGLYSSHLTTWRKAARSGSLKGLSKKRGRKAIERNPLQGKVLKLERENARLEKELHKAHLIIDVQGKVAGLLGLSLEDGTSS